MIYRVTTGNGAEPTIREYVAGGAGVGGDLVAMDTDDDTVKVVAAANATSALGWLTGDMEDGSAINVMEANNNTLVEMPFSGDFTIGMLGGFFGMAGESGAQKVDLTNTANTLFKLIKITRNGTATGHAAGDLRCLVMVPSAKSQAVTSV